MIFQTLFGSGAKDNSGVWSGIQGQSIRNNTKLREGEFSKAPSRQMYTPGMADKTAAMQNEKNMLASRLLRRKYQPEYEAMDREVSSQTLADVQGGADRDVSNIEKEARNEAIRAGAMIASGAGNTFKRAQGPQGEVADAGNTALLKAIFGSERGLEDFRTQRRLAYADRANALSSANPAPEAGLDAASLVGMEIDRDAQLANLQNQERSAFHSGAYEAQAAQAAMADAMRQQGQQYLNSLNQSRMQRLGGLDSTISNLGSMALSAYSGGLFGGNKARQSPVPWAY